MMGGGWQVMGTRSEATPFRIPARPGPDKEPHPRSGPDAAPSRPPFLKIPQISRVDIPWHRPIRTVGKKNVPVTDSRTPLDLLWITL